MKMPEKGGDFILAPAGTHLARCVKLIDLGTMKSEYAGKSSLKRKIAIGWELPFETTHDGEPLIQYSRYTLSSSEKAILRQHLEAWRGKPFTESDFGPNGFEVKTILGTGCSLIIKHTERNGKKYADVTGIGPVAKGMSLPPQHNKSLFVSLDPKEFDQAAFDLLSDGFKNIIMASPEYRQLRGVGATMPGAPTIGELPNDEVPF